MMTIKTPEEMTQEELQAEHAAMVARITAATTAAALDHSVGTGSTLRLDISADNTNNALKLEITANAGENWDHKAILIYSRVTN